MTVLLNPIPTNKEERYETHALGMMDSTGTSGCYCDVSDVLSRFLALRNMHNDSIRERLLRRRNKY